MIGQRVVLRLLMKRLIIYTKTPPLALRLEFCSRAVAFKVPDARDAGQIFNNYYPFRALLIIKVVCAAPQVFAAKSDMKFMMMEPRLIIWIIYKSC